MIILPDIFNKLYFGNTVLQYLIFFGILFVGVILGKILYYITTKIIKKIAKKTKTQLDDIFVDIIEEPLVFLIVVIAFSLGANQLTLSDAAAKAFGGITKTFVTVAFAWFFLKFIDTLIVKYAMPAVSKTETDLDDQLMPLIRNMVKVIIVSLSFIMILSNLGYNVSSILAGLGIGGLAFAFAAKDMLANIFGGLTIILDKPFKLGQWIEAGGHSGEVVEIGLRSTRLKTGNGEFITIPNSVVAEKPTINYKTYNHRLVSFTLGLDCATTNAQMKKAKDIILKAIERHDVVKKDSASVNFTGFGNFSYDLDVRYTINTNNSGKVREIKDLVNSEIKEKFEQAKIGLPYPTQTVHLKK
ncbi:MAG: mechanosensitive ion channel family protein [Nanoarchaeota archaeon]|nr:mechanosensitive ion channel family protein [Nanoarchaeota archaeon]